MHIFETNRLYLRNLTPSDAEHFYLLNLDPEVIRFTGDCAFKNIEAARTFLENYDQYQKYGLGRWAVIRKKDKMFLGWCGLKYTESQQVYDIGFRLFRSFWHRGYATEAARACLVYGFQELGLTEIVGRVMRQNIGSIKVLQKIGMQYQSGFNFDGSEGVLYHIKKEKSS